MLQEAFIMQTYIKTSFLFFTFTLFLCLNSFFLMNAAAQGGPASVSDNYTFETISVSGVQFLALTASSDPEYKGYAGYTKSADGEKDVAFTLIDSVFKTYDFPGAQETRFYALGNNGDAAGYYVDSEGRHRGIVLENGVLRQEDFPGSVQTEIWGISDTTGALTGNFIDAEGIRRGFTGDEIIEIDGASETYADFVNSSGGMVGSYVDADGLYHPYVRTPDGKFVSLDLPQAANLEYFFVHGINDARVVVARTKRVDDLPITLVGTFQEGLKRFQVPGSVFTEGYNINQDGSIVGHYESSDGRILGFIARPADQAVDEPVVATPTEFNFTFESIDVPGVQFLALTASSDFEDYAGYTKSADGKKDVAFTLIDGEFKRYDYPGSQKTHFYALDNKGKAAGHYMDTDGNYHGVVLENGELQRYDFPGAEHTFIYGISDATGALTGSFIDSSGVRRGFTGDEIIKIDGASETYADFVNASGQVVGSYKDTEGLYHPYMRQPTGRLISLDLPQAASFEFFFIHGINDVGTLVARSKRIGDVVHTSIGSLQHGLHPLLFPGSVSTEGWNINQDGSIVGHYDSGDGRTHGFIARPTTSDTQPVVETPPQVNIEPVTAPDDSKYTFERIDVAGVDFLALTASSDFEDYAGYTKSADGEKMVAFTLIDGVFMTYDFPGAQETRFYALGNNGDAAGYYVDSEGRHQGVVLEDGKLRQYDFPDAVQTEIWGISDATGALTGNFIDASGIRRGFSGDIIVEFPGALETYADFVNAEGGMVGSYVDADGIYNAYVRVADGDFVSLKLTTEAKQEYFFVHGINDARVVVARAKLVDAPPFTYVGLFPEELQELKFPGSVSTEGYNINQDGSVVGHYDSADGRTHGFIAKPIAEPDPPLEEPVVPPAEINYTFETIDVPGVDFLALTASSDPEYKGYAGYTKSADGEKYVAFTLIDGVFTTHDFPGAQNTYFYALDSDGRAAGYYEDSEGLHHGIIWEDGELHQYDFHDAVQTEIYGISDATGVLTGNWLDAAGVRRGFSGDTIIEYPEASATYADFTNAEGSVIGSFIDAQGVYKPYIRHPDGKFLSLDLPHAALFEYFFVPGGNDAGYIVARAKLIGDIPRTAVGTLQHGLQSLEVPGSVSTDGWNINQDGSIVGNYVSPDGRTHGFIARLTAKAESDHFGNFYTATLSKGLNMLSVPLAPPNPMTAKSLAGIAGATVVITLDAENQRFVAWTPSAPNDGFPIKGGQGYIVNVPQARKFAFVGSRWENQTEAAAPAISTKLPHEAWAFVVSGRIGKPNSYERKSAYDGYQVNVRNLRTNNVITASVQDNYFAAATADLARRSVVKVGDVIEVRVIGPDGNIESQTRSFKVTPEHLANAVLPVKLDNVGQPMQNLLLQNYPNPFNPETWIPYQLSEDSAVSIGIYDTTGKLVRTLLVGHQSAGFYNSPERAAYWNGQNALGEHVASGVYFYQLTTPKFQQTRRLVILK